MLGLGLVVVTLVGAKFDEYLVDTHTAYFQYEKNLPIVFYYKYALSTLDVFPHGFGI